MSDVRVFNAADRFVDAQHWWIAAELCRRHPEFAMLEVGHEEMGSSIAVLGEVEGCAARVGLSRVGGIRVSGVDDFCIAPPEVLSEPNAHGVLKRVERALGVPAPSHNMRTTRENIGYRVIAQILTTKVNDRRSWTLRGERQEDPHVRDGVPWMGEAAQWPSVLELRRRWGAEAAVGEVYDAPCAQAWLLMADLGPVAVFDRYGFVRAEDGACDLMLMYREARGDIAVVAAEIVCSQS